MIGVNPKINNMIRAFEEAKSEFIWVTDSSILGIAGYLWLYCLCYSVILFLFSVQ